VGAGRRAEPRPEVVRHVQRSDGRGVEAGVIVREHPKGKKMWRGMHNNIYTQVGLVLLVGPGAKNAILIVEFAKARRGRGCPCCGVIWGVGAHPMILRRWLT
jgi:hypothetical protein